MARRRGDRGLPPRYCAGAGLFVQASKAELWDMLHELLVEELDEGERLVALEALLAELRARPRPLPRLGACPQCGREVELWRSGHRPSVLVYFRHPDGSGAPCEGSGVAVRR